MSPAETRAITANSLQAVLGMFRCEKMRRAWRNRSPVTQSRWIERALGLLARTPASQINSRQLAAALYCACGEHTWNDDSFRPKSLAPTAWAQIDYNVHKYLWNLPDKALTRGAYYARLLTPKTAQ